MSQQSQDSTLGGLGNALSTHHTLSRINISPRTGESSHLPGPLMVKDLDSQIKIHMGSQGLKNKLGETWGKCRGCPASMCELLETLLLPTHGTHPSLTEDSRTEDTGDTGT